MNSMRTADKRIHADSTNWRNDHTMQLRTKEQHEAAIRYYTMLHGKHFRDYKRPKLVIVDGVHEFTTRKEAAKFINATTSAIRQAVNTGYKCNGHTVTEVKQ